MDFSLLQFYHGTRLIQFQNYSYFELILSYADSYYRDKRLASRIIFAVWILSAFVVISAYIARFTSLLAIQKYDYLVHDINDLASRSDVKVFIIKGMTVEDFIMNSKDAKIKLIADQLRRNPHQKLPIDKQANLSRIIQGKSVMIQVNSQSLVTNFVVYSVAFTAQSISRVTCSPRLLGDQGMQTDDGQEDLLQHWIQHIPAKE